MSSAKSLGHFRILEESLKNPWRNSPWSRDLIQVSQRISSETYSFRPLSEPSTLHHHGFRKKCHQQNVFASGFAPKWAAASSIHIITIKHTEHISSVPSTALEKICIYIYKYHLWHQNFKNIIPLLKTNHAYWGKMRTYKPFYEFTQPSE
jgi:hypothetical protein